MGPATRPGKAGWIAPGFQKSSEIKNRQGHGASHQPGKAGWIAPGMACASAAQRSCNIRPSALSQMGTASNILKQTDRQTLNCFVGRRPYRHTAGGALSVKAPAADSEAYGLRQVRLASCQQHGPAIPLPPYTSPMTFVGTDLYPGTCFVYPG